MNSGLSFTVKFIALILIIFLLNNSEWMGGHQIVARSIKAAYTFLSTSILISISRFILLFFYSKKNKGKTPIHSNFVIGINQLSTILNVTFMVIAVFVLLGIDIKEFLTSITLIAMAIALIFREYITNMISGLIIMFSDKYEVSNYIKIGEHNGRIEDIGLQNIRIITEDGDSVMIPNNTFFISSVTNKSIDNRGRYNIEFQIPFNSEMNQIKLLEDTTVQFFKTYSDIQLQNLKLSLSKVTFEYYQYKLTLEYEHNDNIIFSKIKSDYLKHIFSNK